MAVTRWLLDESKFLSTRQVRKLLKAAELRAQQNSEPRSQAALRDYVIMHLALATGLRVAELAILTCGNILIDGAMASLRVRCPVGGKPRTVHFNGVRRPFSCVIFNGRKSTPDMAADARPRDPDGPAPGMKPVYIARAICEQYPRQKKMVNTRTIEVDGKLDDWAGMQAAEIVRDGRPVATRRTVFDAENYTLETAVPLKSLELDPPHDPTVGLNASGGFPDAGGRVRSRAAHWAGQSEAAVVDRPGSAALLPSTWGTLVFDRSPLK